MKNDELHFPCNLKNINIVTEKEFKKTSNIMKLLKEEIIKTFDMSNNKYQQ